MGFPYGTTSSRHLEDISVFESIYRNKKFFIHCDTRKQQLILYGSDNLFKASTQWTIAILTSHASKYIIRLPGGVLTDTLAERFRHVVLTFGKMNAKLHLASQPAAVVFKGSPRDLDKARSLLLEQPNPDTEDLGIDGSNRMSSLLH